MTYTREQLAEFARANADAIYELLADDAESMGYANIAALVASFNRADMADTRDGYDCLLAWYALETIGRWLTDQGYDEDDES